VSTVTNSKHKSLKVVLVLVILMLVGREFQADCLATQNDFSLRYSRVLGTTKPPQASEWRQASHMRVL